MPLPPSVQGYIDRHSDEAQRAEHKRSHDLLHMLFNSMVIASDPDYADFLEAVAAANSNGKTLYIPDGEYTVDEVPVVTTHIWAAPGAVLNAPGLQVGDGDALNYLQSRLPHVYNSETTWFNGGDDSSIGVRLLNVNNSEIFIPRGGGYGVGVCMEGRGTGCANNEVTGLALTNNKINFQGIAVGQGGYCSENTVSIQRYAIGHEAEGTRQIQILAQNGGWAFVRGSMEGQSAEYMIEHHGNRSTFWHMRYESDVTARVYFGETAFGNKLDGGHHVENVEVTGDYEGTQNARCYVDSDGSMVEAQV